MEAGFEEGTVKGFTTSEKEGTEYVFSFSSSDLRLLRLRLKRNRPSTRSEMKTSPPITPPIMAPVGFEFLTMVVGSEVEELGEELDELVTVYDGTLVKVEELSDVEDDGASC